MADAAAVEIYTSKFCGFCVRAKKLLTQKGVSFTERDVSADRDGRTPVSYTHLTLPTTPYV